MRNRRDFSNRPFLAEVMTFLRGRRRSMFQKMIPPISLKFGRQLDIRIPYEEPKRFFKMAVPGGRYGVFKVPFQKKFFRPIGIKFLWASRKCNLPSFATNFSSIGPKMAELQPI